MSYKKLLQMASLFKETLGLNKARVVCLIAVIWTAIEANSLLLTSIANRIAGKAKPKSKFRRIQHFFLEIILDFKQVALLIMAIAKIDPKTPMILALDRTDWERRENVINILTLSVCKFNGGSFPLKPTLESLSCGET